MTKDEKQLNTEINRLLKQLEQLIYTNYLLALNLYQVKNSLSDATPFWFSRNYEASKQMDKIISDFSRQANVLFLNGIERSWKTGEESVIDKIKLAFSGNARQQKAFDQLRIMATQEQRNRGAQASIKRYVEGINLSERVWKLGNGIKQEIETIVQNGMKEGKSADQLSKELRKYLNEPDKLYRKVRNKETGELELSEAAKKYKPGQGTYRSAKKNAMRLARTEINAAYRHAAWERFQDDPRVIGIHISLSNNHTCLNPRTGKPEPFYDICDELAGDYPKSFHWTGWHPQCRCVMNPIIVSGDEAIRMIEAKAAGKDYTPKQIKSVPSQFQKWVENNKDRIDAANNRGTLPYWLKDNPKFTGITVKKDPNTQNMDKNEYSKNIKYLRDWAKENLAQKSVYHDDFGKDIMFTVTGIKEYLNQPHRYYFEKNQLIKDIQNVIKKSEYKGFAKYMGRTSHIFEIEIKGDKNWIIANEREDGKVTFYSISDSDKVLNGIKK